MRKLITSKTLQGLILYAALGVISSAAELSIVLTVCMFVVVLLIEKISRDEAFEEAFKLGWGAGIAHTKANKNQEVVSTD